MLYLSYSSYIVGIHFTVYTYIRIKTNIEIKWDRELFIFRKGVEILQLSL